jgi:hypothetical protein
MPTENPAARPAPNDFRERITTALHEAATIAEARWTPGPDGFGIVDILAAAMGGGRPDSIDLWDVVVTHLGEQLTVPWERQPGRTREEVAAMLRAAAEGAQS